MSIPITQGHLGMESVLQWVQGGGSFTFNALDEDPRYKVDRMPGLNGLPDADDFRQAKTARIGEVVHPGLPRGKTFTIEGRIQARSMADLRTMTNDLRAAFADRSNEGTLRFVATDAYAGEADPDYFFCTARVLQLDVDEEFSGSLTDTRSPYWQKFLIGLRMSDPRFYWSGAREETAATARTLTFDVNGTAPVDPVITIGFEDTDIGKIEISNTSITLADGTHPKLVWGDGLGSYDTPESGGLLTAIIDFSARTALWPRDDWPYPNDLVTYYHPELSTWWDLGVPGLIPGSNTITVNAGDTGARSLQINWYDGSW